jgi:hypothetical protein
MSVLVPAIAALAGAFIGSLGPLVIGVIQSRAEHKRERLRLATQLAVEDHKMAVEMVKLNRRGGVPPLSVYVAYHADLLAVLATGKLITPEDVAGARERSRAVLDAVDEAQAADPKSQQRPSAV